MKRQSRSCFLCHFWFGRGVQAPEPGAEAGPRRSCSRSFWGMHGPPLCSPSATGHLPLCAGSGHLLLNTAPLAHFRACLCLSLSS